LNIKKIIVSSNLRNSRLHRIIKNEAKKNNRTISAEIAYVLEDYYKKNTKNNKGGIIK